MNGIRKGSLARATKGKVAKAEHRYTEEQYRLALESANDVVISIDERSAILFTNPAVMKIFGYESTEIIGKPLTVLMPDFLHVFHDKGLSRSSVTHPQPINWQGIELIALHKNRQQFPVEVSLVELTGKGRKVFTAFIRDISQRKQAEEMRATQTRQVAVRADVSLAFGHEESLETILLECAQSIVRHLDAAFARIWTVSRDGTMLELRASAGLYTHLDGAHARLPMGSLKIGMIAQEQKPLLTNDVINDPRISDRAWVAKEGISSFAGHPLVVGMRTVGVMGMFSRNPLTAGTAETLASVADLIAQGIERKRAEDKLRASERTLRELTETIPQMLWSAEADGALNYCNQRLLDYTALSSEQVSGSHWIEVAHPDDVERMTREWKAAVSSGNPFQYEFRCLRAADHEYRWCISSALPLRDQNGEVQKWFGTVVDLHDWKEAQQSLQKMQAELERVSKLTTMGELAASIAHEVKQPIAAALINAKTCLRWLRRAVPDVEKGCEAASRMVRDAARAAEIIERIRSLYRRDTAEREVFDLNEMIRELIVLLHDRMRHSSIAIRSELDPALPPITADRVQLQQVLMNLMLNAIDAMKETSGALTVTSKRADDDKVLIAVSDSGVGLPLAHMDRIFEAFFTTKPQGTGMGLSISRRIIQSHGGRLWATPNPEGGATFKFTLPCQLVTARSGT